MSDIDDYVNKEMNEILNEHERNKKHLYIPFAVLLIVSNFFWIYHFYNDDCYTQSLRCCPDVNECMVEHGKSIARYEIDMKMLGMEYVKCVTGEYDE